MIEIISLEYPLKLRGQVAGHDFVLFAKMGYWCFYIEDHAFSAGDDHLFALVGKFPFAEQMPQPLALRIAKACAEHFQRRLRDEETFLQNTSRQ